MKFRTSQELRDMWLSFYQEKAHAVIPSASLVPEDDPTLLWINSGVAALKPYFDGSKPAPAKRLVNLQKCIRTNDIESVGYTARHQTMFEMVGHFSIGDYFKEEAMAWNLEFLTSEKYLGLDINRLYFTVYPTDDEAYSIWINLGINPSHIIKTDYNFWEIGAGPCGPNSEFFYDRGPEFGDFTTEAIEKDIENDRYIEMGNIVFSQYNSKPGLSREDYPELPQKNIDMGGGFERIVSVIQDAKTNFETDLFLPIIQEIEFLTEQNYTGQVSFKIIADHIRTLVMALADGAVMSNEGRGYVLRRLLRRAMKHGRSLGRHDAFLYQLVPTVIDLFKAAYPEIVTQQDRIIKMIKKGEELFLITLVSGVKRLESIDTSIIDGQAAFELYDTYGFPIELTIEYANEHGKTVDTDGFNDYMKQQQERARSARNVDTAMNLQDERLVAFTTPSTFIGYESLEVRATVIAVFDHLVITDETPFYAESGGQTSDQGTIDGLEVQDVQKGPNGQHVHVVHDHDFHVGETVDLQVDPYTRYRTMGNHSAIHLMYAALRQKLQGQVAQRGSFVNHEYLRFDMAYDEEITDEVLLEIETMTNQWIKERHVVTTEELTLEEAKARGAIAEFGEKYSSAVRVVSMGDVTVDLCGGTHVMNTYDIDSFALAGFESKGAGIYRFTGYTGEGIESIRSVVEVFANEAQKSIDKAHRIAKENQASMISLPSVPLLMGSYRDILNYRDYLHEIQFLVKEFEKTLQDQKTSSALEDLSMFDSQIQGPCLVTHVSSYPADIAKQLIDRLAEKVGIGTVFLVSEYNEQLLLLAKSNHGVHCGNLVKKAAQIAGGNGGGREDFAQAGAKDTTKIHEILTFVKGELSCGS